MSAANFRIITRYILREITIPFVIILGVLTFVLLMGKILQLMDLLLNKGISAVDIGRLIFFLIPSQLTYTLPVSFLISVLIGIGRLSSDNEITVLKMSGVSLHQLFLPVACVSLIAFLLTAASTLFLAPLGNLASRNLLFNLARQKASISLQEKVFIDDFPGILIYAEHIPAHGDYLEGVIIYDQRTAREAATIFARRARLVADPHNRSLTLRLERGSTHNVDSSFSQYRKMDFLRYDIRLDIPASPHGDSGSKKGSEMSVTELLFALREGSPLPKHELSLTLNKRIAIPFSCLVFAIVGLPLGIRSHRSVRSRGLTVGLMLVLIYYVLRIWAETLALTQKTSALLAAWMPNLLFLTAGIILYYFATRERNLPLLRRR